MLWFLLALFTVTGACYIEDVLCNTFGGETIICNVVGYTIGATIAVAQGAFNWLAKILGT